MILLYINKAWDLLKRAGKAVGKEGWAPYMASGAARWPLAGRGELGSGRSPVGATLPRHLEALQKVQVQAGAGG